MANALELTDELIESMTQRPEVKTRQQAVEAATRLVEKVQGQKAALDALWGLGWDGDYEDVRSRRENKHADWESEHHAA